MSQTKVVRALCVRQSLRWARRTKFVFFLVLSPVTAIAFAAPKRFRLHISFEMIFKAIAKVAVMSPIALMVSIPLFYLEGVACFLVLAVPQATRGLKLLVSPTAIRPLVTSS